MAACVWLTKSGKCCVVQVGKDTDAQAFLGRLDNDRDIGGMIDATSYFELEAEEYQRRGVVLTPELWMVKLMVGAIDPTYDEQVSNLTLFYTVVFLLGCHACVP